MKKLAAAFLSVVMIAGAVFALTACSPNYVDTGGNYKAATAEEVSAVLDDVQEELAGAYDIYLLLDVKQDRESMMFFEIDGRISFADSGLNMNVSYEVSLLGESEKFNVYADNNYLYMNGNGNKIKVEYSGDPTEDLMPSASSSLNDVLAELKAGGAKYDLSMATNGDETKIKIELDLADMDMELEGASGSIPMEVYLIVENGHINAYAVKCDYSLKIEGKTYSYKIDMQYGGTDEAVSLPSDLDTYSTSL